MRKNRYDEDGDVIELGDDFFKNAKPMKDVMPDFVNEITALQQSGQLTVKAVGRPKQSKTKKQVTVRLDEDIIDFFKRDGRGWQTRLNNALSEYIACS